MPYRDPRRKQEWEHRNRLRRLARRRELRREQTAERQDVAPVSPDPVVGQGFPWLLLGGGGLMFALYKPAIALGAGGLTLAIAALQKKGWQWWVFGGLIVVVALFRLFNEQRGDTINAISAKK